MLENLENRRVLSGTGFTISLQSSSVVAGTPELLTITPPLVAGAAFTDTFTFSSTDAKASLPASYTFKNALPESFLVSFKTVAPGKNGTPGLQTLTVTDTSTLPAATVKTLPVTVTPAALDRFLVTGIPTPYTAAVPASLTVTAVDKYGNTETSYAGTVAFATSDTAPIAPTLPANYTFKKTDLGTHTFSVTLQNPALKASVTVTDTVNVNPVTNLPIKGTEGGIQVLPAVRSATHFTLSLAAGTQVTAGVPAKVTITAVDQFGGTVKGYAGTLDFSSSDPRAQFPAVAPANAFLATYLGKHTFTVKFETVGSTGTQTLTVTDATTKTILGTLTVTVVPAAAKSFVVEGPTGSVATGSSQNVVVTAIDAYGNVATGYTGTVELSSPGLTAPNTNVLAPQTYTFTTGTGGDNGTHTFSVTIGTALGAYALDAVDTVTATIKGKTFITIT